MKKIIKNPIFTFILGAIIFGTVGVYAVSVSSKDVSYNNTNVESAINDLYSKVNTSSGELRIVELGTATSYDIKTLYPDIYDKLTIDNFYYKISNSTSSYGYCDGCKEHERRLTAPVLSYDNATGVLSISYGIVSNYDKDMYGYWYPIGASLTIVPTCYMVYTE